MYKQIELKPCPFCGGAATAKYEHRAYSIRSRKNYVVVSVLCDECGGGYDDRMIESEDIEKAVKAAIKEWNRRTNNG